MSRFILLFISLLLPLRAETHLVKPGDSLRTAFSRPGLTVLKFTPGTYRLTAPIRIKAKNLKVEGSGAIISGGIPLSGWKPEGKTPGLWKAANPTLGRIPHQMYSVKEGRLQRSRIPNEGYLRGFALSAVDFDVNRPASRDFVNDWRKTRQDIFSGLRLPEGTPAPGEGAILQHLASWESSWHPVKFYDSRTRDLHLHTPARYPFAHWNYGVNEGGGSPFAVENVRAGLDLPGEWYFDESKDNILLLLETGRKPLDGEFVIPGFETLFEIDGAKNLTFTGLTFAHTSYRLGKYDLHPGWPRTPPLGLSVAQSAPQTGAAVTVENSKSLVFSNCRFRDTGAWGIRLGEGSREVLIDRCQFHRLGAGGVEIDGGTPLKNTVRNCTITDGGQVHPAAVGIRVSQAQETVIEHNEIARFGYSGIHFGWSWNPRPNRNRENIVRRNHVHHVMQLLSDGAAIYTLGQCQGMIIEENYLHDIPRSKWAVGSGSSGIFFDQHSSGTTTRRNVIRRIQSYLPESKRENHPIKHNKNVPEDHVISDNDIDAGDKPVVLSEVIAKAGVQE